ncbi:exodeoxyribonuclease V subunit beta [Buchnera aphidicola (Thelaxes californica)]|uniref:RecBCD enzyme subunit RecB n=1 Tax=Buchnera aphidicola (Thelaxes californica) TaxID=1315998 RepID=A0A4D6YCS3_9GAMM|nr:exodeoxyribonuclease V subunit beta [Buchnera aphidicola]QCI26872.1 exodeoxyribonuclease V subunit beta [Buchnera aphidicola (Thelaxes californica)]
MKNIILKKLDILNIPLDNQILIEASAGTGKTFNIALLYIRMILKININNSKTFNIKNINQIVLISYTNKSLEELKKRIIILLSELKQSCFLKHTTISYIKPFFKYIHDFEYTTSLLEYVENNIDYISCYTVHSFFSHIIQENKYFLKNVNNFTIFNNQKKIYIQSCYDFWRQYCYTLSYDIMKIIYSYWNTPEQLFSDIYPFLQNFNNFFLKHKKKNISINIQHLSLIKKIHSFKKFLFLNKIFIEKILQNKKNEMCQKNVKILEILLTWTKITTKDYYIPKEMNIIYLKILKKNICNIKKEKKKIIQTIINFSKIKFSIKEIFLHQAINFIKKNIKKIKLQENKLEFEDLIEIVYLNVVIKENPIFIYFIRKNFPIIIIDEYQDIDIKSNKIFNKIYKKQPRKIMLLIGDPKQTIYEFRGASINSYFNYKKNIIHQYYLDINWRSSSNLVDNINHIFSIKKYPFITKNILYKKIITPEKNKKMIFKINNIVQPSFRIFFNNIDKNLNIHQYYQWSSEQCAEDINFLINNIENKKAKIFIKNKVKILSIKDITILVRNQQESEIIQSALKRKKIVSKYFSKQKNLFHTQEAEEISWILEALLNIHEEKNIFKALSINILNIKLNTLFKISKSNFNENILIIFQKYLNILKTQGILNLIKYLIINKKKYFRKNKNDEKKYINFLTLGEILEQKYYQLKNLELVLNWIKKKIIEKNYKKNELNPINQSNYEYITIISIHQSKGLEFPIVWFPFSSAFLHHHNSFFSKKNQDLNSVLKTKFIKKSILHKKKLSEEIRLFYVAITRPSIHCSFTIAPINICNKKNNTYTDITNSGLGYLITSKKCTNIYDLKKIVQQTFSSQNNIEIFYYFSFLKNYIKKNNNQNKNIQKKKHIYLKKTIKKQFKITSYTNLLSEKTKESFYLPIFNKKKEKNNIYYKKKKIKTPFFFEKGQEFGTFIHHILKNINFNKTIDIILLSQQLKNFYFPQCWKKELKIWLEKIVNTTLLPLNIKLKELKKHKILKEFEFYMSVNKTLHNYQFNQCIKKKDKISSLSSNLEFNSFKGIVTGFIDLIFELNNKFFIVDYKTNWLGDNYADYNNKNIEKTMINHRYDVQYHLYGIVLHKYLKQRITKYSIKKNFGGIFYLFLRGMDINHNNQSIFYIPPNIKLMKKLNKLF